MENPGTNEVFFAGEAGVKPGLKPGLEGEPFGPGPF